MAKAEIKKGSYWERLSDTQKLKKGSYWERLSDTQKLKKAKRDKNNVLKRKTSHGTATWAGR